MCKSWFMVVLLVPVSFVPVRGQELQFFDPAQRARQASAEDAGYQRGQAALDAHRWDEALDAFGKVAAAGGPRADGALYWKAYALGKLGRRAEALAAIAQLRQAYGSSKWVVDARALELRAACDLAELRAGQGRSDEAYAVLAPLCGSFTEGEDTSDLRRARSVLDSLGKGTCGRFDAGS